MKRKNREMLYRWIKEILPNLYIAGFDIISSIYGNSYCAQCKEGYTCASTIEGGKGEKKYDTR